MITHQEAHQEAIRIIRSVMQDTDDLLIAYPEAEAERIALALWQILDALDTLSVSGGDMHAD